MRQYLVAVIDANGAGALDIFESELSTDSGEELIEALDEWADVNGYETYFFIDNVSHARDVLDEFEVEE